MLRKTMVKRKQVQPSDLDDQPEYIKLIKKGIWLYYFLLIFEGALRKWVLPQFASPLLIIRDPLVIYVLYLALKNGVMRSNGYQFLVLSVGVLSFAMALTIAHRNLVVALFGLRILVLHFPFMFVIQRVFTKEDIIKMGRITLLLSIPFIALIIWQFYSPQTAFVNRGIGDDEDGAGFAGALGYYRPPGTFSFTNGNSLFFSLAALFVIYFWFNLKYVNKTILLAATAAIIMSIPFSISRALFFQVLVTIAFAGIVIARRPKYAGAAVVSAIFIGLLIFILRNSSFFQTGVDVFSTRFENANKSEGGVEGALLDRYLGGLVEAIRTSYDRPLFGLGLGAGTNVGSTLLIGSKKFLAGEGEWGRLVNEIGPLFGLIIILVRLAMSFDIARKGFRLLSKGDTLPWMLLSFAILLLPQGSWAQPTSLGFSTLVGGLALASVQTPVKYQKKIRRIVHQEF